jgi:hypothetical protein
MYLRFCGDALRKMEKKTMKKKREVEYMIFAVALDNFVEKMVDSCDNQTAMAV